MDDYLKSTFDKLHNGNYTQLNIVLGNESCDLDSAVCTLVYATFLHWEYQHSAMSKEHNAIFIPILNVKKEDYALKTEVKFCLDEHGLIESKLFFRDQYNLEELVKTTPTNVILVDHHVLAKDDQFLAPYVTEIIDHRPLSRSSWQYEQYVRKTMDIVGSCSTLVAQRIREKCSVFGDDDDDDTTFFSEFQVCTELLHCAIILDTVNFDIIINKATRLDNTTAVFLESIMKPNFRDEERRCKLDYLMEAKNNISHLTPVQLIKKDLKIVENILIPSLPILVEEFLKMPEAVDAIKQSLVAYDCKIAVLLGMRLRPEVCRDMALYSQQGVASLKQLEKFLDEWPHPPLALIQAEPVEAAPDCLHFKQSNVLASRKQYINIIRDYFKVAKDEFNI